MMENKSQLYIIIINLILIFGLAFWFNQSINLLNTNIDTLSDIVQINSTQLTDTNNYPILIESLVPSVVQIQSFNNDLPLTSGHGSGIIVSDNGYILTNAHVVGYGEANQILVTSFDNDNVDGELVGVAACDDIALIQLPQDSYPSANFSEDSAQAGTQIISIGYAYNNFIGANFPASSNGYLTRTNLSVSNYVDLIQHNAGLNAGDSGGAVFNHDGFLMGMNSFRPDGSQGIGFAIGIAHLQTTYQQLLETMSPPPNFEIGQTSDTTELQHPLDRDCWSFEAIAGEEIQIEVVNVDPHVFEPEVLLYGPTNLLISIGEPTDETRRGKQITITPQVNGIFTVMIGRTIVQQDRIGTYTISVIETETTD